MPLKLELFAIFMCMNNTPTCCWVNSNHHSLQNLNKCYSSFVTELIIDQKAATIMLIGAGPGDPDLLTVAGARELGDASKVVIADRLISDEILSLVKGTLLVANKHPGCAEDAQNEIYEWVTAAVLSGKSVIRLKIGDPFVFGRGGEEVVSAHQ
jgi:hypothetical protein